MTKTGQDPRTATEAELSAGDGVHVDIGEFSMTLIKGQRLYSDKTKLVRQQTVEVPLSQILKETVKEGRSPIFQRVQLETAEQVVDEPHSEQETIEVVRVAPQEQGHQRIGEQTAKALESREERDCRCGEVILTRTSATALMPPEIFDVKKTFLANLVSWCVIFRTKSVCLHATVESRGTEPQAGKEGA